MTAQVSIVLGGARNALTIPRSALGWRIAYNRYKLRMLAQNDQSQTHEIRVGLTNDTNAQVLSGLVAGDRVIVGDSHEHAQKKADQESLA